MEEAGRYRELREYRDEDMAAAFGADLWLGGCTAVPNLLLRYYRRIGLTDQEVVLVVQLMRLRVEEGLLYPGAGRLAECMELSPDQAEKALQVLSEKELVAVGRFFDTHTKEVVEGYDLGPLFKRLAVVWFNVKMEQGQEARSMAAQEAPGSIHLAFEKEFGRTFSPIEIEQIDKWLGEVPPPLLMEALRRAVLRGKHNLRYIDTIILQWTKNNLRTLEEVIAYENQYRGRRKGRAEPKADDDAEARRKELLKSVYAN